MCCSLQKGATWVWSHPHAAQPRRPQTLPVVVLLQSQPLVPQLPDALLVLAELLRQPALLPAPLAQLCFSLPHPGAGGQERLLHPCQLWGHGAHGDVTNTPLSERGDPTGTQTPRGLSRPYLGRGGRTAASGSGCPRAAPGSPRSAAAPAPAPGRTHRRANLQRGTGAEPLSAAPRHAGAEGFSPCNGGVQSLPPPPQLAPLQPRTAGLAGRGQAALQLLPEPVVGADGLLQALAQAADLQQVLLQQVCP